MKRTRIWKCMLALLLALTMLQTSVGFAATGAQIISAVVEDTTVKLMLENAGQGKIYYVIAKGVKTVESGFIEYAGGSEQSISLAGLDSIPQDVYTVSLCFIDAAGNKSNLKTVRANLGEGSHDNANNSGQSGTGAASLKYLANLGYMRTVMVPYAGVFSDSGLSDLIFDLKRLDMVHVISVSGGVAYVSVPRYYSEAGDVHIVGPDYDPDNDVPDDGGGETVSFDEGKTVYIEGYMSSSAFVAPTISGLDLPREAVEIGYTRLGYYGIYSRAKRYIDNYVDCSSFVTWCYYQAGFDFGGPMNCDGLGRWSDGQPDFVTVWDAVKDNTAAAKRIDDYIMTNPWYPDWINPLSLFTPPDPEFTFSDNGDTFTVSYEEMRNKKAMSYTGEITKDDLATFQMGDVVLWNTVNKVECNWPGEPMYMCVDTFSNGQGLDHTGMIVGIKDNSMLVIEAVTPYVKITELSLSSARMNGKTTGGSKIVKILRPASLVTQRQSGLKTSP